MLIMMAISLFPNGFFFVYQHIQYKAQYMGAISTPRYAKSKQSFQSFLLEGVQSEISPAYKELYHFLLKCFTDADADLDGKVGPYEFDAMIEASAVHARKFGLAPGYEQLYDTLADRINARALMMQEMDTNKDGVISFSEWLEYCLKHIKTKSDKMNSSGGQEKNKTETEIKDKPQESNDVKKKSVAENKSQEAGNKPNKP